MLPPLCLHYTIKTFRVFEQFSIFKYKTSNKTMKLTKNLCK
uniref:Uncharacterized protein n=1 Tax=Ciona intestinalis TaxID=7719 RepID=H2Y176_CIOIN